MLIGFICGLICGFLCGVLRISHVISDIIEKYYPVMKEDILSGRLERIIKGEDNE